jgi:hypothetical protein
MSTLWIWNWNNTAEEQRQAQAVAGMMTMRQLTQRAKFEEKKQVLFGDNMMLCLLLCFVLARFCGVVLSNGHRAGSHY